MRFLVAILAAAGTAHGAQKKAAVSKSGDIKVKSSLGQRLLSQARRENGRALEEDGIDYSYVADYALRFQGCHHISQWNGEAEDENDVRVYTKRLVRFRLCPSGSCSEEETSGCSSKYGDYVVDMNTFIAAWLEAQEEDKEARCDYVEELCQDQCDGNDDDDCEYACYGGYSATYCVEDDDDGVNFDPMDYAECAQFDFGRRRRLDGDEEYYVGPYCADQGGEIHLGLFTDDTCTAFSSLGESGFYDMAGYELPYSDSPGLVSNDCLSCAEQDNNGDYDVREICENIYAESGKCETKMSIDYPNESACTYIEGIKIIREDGVIRTTTTKKSKAAAVCIGLFTTIAVLLGAYVYYLRTKLGRAKINLSSGGGSLT
eukprot:CAMPEP_0183309386 /NCGR_PEP_ID=MMETSP0160_2-20130417/25268_1 /TAXON_ID=2839 ORGANISM="Odontella Sinensis, Strain Grunow 1884" /NCGR_SAMPLE_ID=MMETSP0160_2 /ASSEMBLY_ACC=CAM_ASM_000250 /LENGTH=373 /DNA_ID=CAMNT_0025473411 /DNA_START=73 /DNA_END=1194 /DNA_ORIENTATION=+